MSIVLRTALVVGLVATLPSLVLAQSASRVAPAAQDSADEVYTFYQSGLATTQEPAPSAPARAARTRSTAVVPLTPLAPAAQPQVWSPSGVIYSTQTAPYYRYAVANDKEMQDLVDKETELSKKTTELVRVLKAAAADKKAEVRTQLTTVVEEHFAVRQQQRELQLKRIEEEVKKLREAIEKRNTAKKEIIERRIAELTGEDTIGF